MDNIKDIINNYETSFIDKYNLQLKTINILNDKTGENYNVIQTKLNVLKENSINTDEIFNIYEENIKNLDLIDNMIVDIEDNYNKLDTNITKLETKFKDYEKIKSMIENKKK